MKNLLKVLTLIIVAPVFLVAQPGGESKQGNSDIVMKTGDSPLQPFTSYEGNGAALIKTYNYSAVSLIIDSIIVSTIPLDATVKEAYIIFSDWRYDSLGAAAVFNGDSLKNAQIFIDIDDSYHLTTTVFDVKNIISGNGQYSIIATNINQCYFMSLVVIYESPSSKELSLYLNIGSESLQLDSSATYFDFANAHAKAKVVLLTQAADPSGSADEQVLFNDEIILGPGELFYGNLGPFSDQITIDSVDIVAGENKLEIVTGSDWFGFHLAMVAHGDLVSSIEHRGQSKLAKRITLQQNYPNPFNPSTNIVFDIPATGSVIEVELLVYNILGQKVATLYQGSVKPGHYNSMWSGLDDIGNQVPAGIYFYRLVSDNFTQSKRMLLIK